MFLVVICKVQVYEIISTDWSLKSSQLINDKKNIAQVNCIDTFVSERKI